MITPTLKEHQKPALPMGPMVEMEIKKEEMVRMEVMILVVEALEVLAMTTEEIVVEVEVILQVTPQMVRIQ